MSNSRRRAAAAAAVALAITYGIGPALAGERAADRPAKARPVAGARAAPAPHGLKIRAAAGRVTVETVSFADRQRSPVRVIRGTQKQSAPVPAGRTEIVGFGSSSPGQVTVIRGGPAPPPAPPVKAGPELAATAPSKTETVNFADSALPAVTVVRGTAPLREFFSVDLFSPANLGELDRVAFAVDGIESRHGADPRMWRPELDGPQGPMQVSAKAAFDVGGGDRFDLRQNRMLGRAYLAQMFRRYGNWADALAAYNWGPGNLDQWIASGRNPSQLPLETARYILRVMRDALIVTAARL